MALQLGALNQALRKAGVDEDLARQAAEEVATHEDRLVGIEKAIVELRAHVDQRISDMEQRIVELRAEVSVLRGELNTLRWAFGFMFAVQVAILVKLFVH